MRRITLWGFGGSTFMTTIRMLLAEKGVTAYQEARVNRTVVLNPRPIGLI